MGTIWVKEFTGGLDTRRMPVTTSGGVLVKAENGHISRGGEFEKRAAFVPEFVLPAGTLGLAETIAGVYVFGSIAEPAGIPAGITYQRLQHENGVTALTQVLAYDLYAGKMYVVGKFADGTVYHFYDGTRVAAWADGYARASLTVTGGVDDDGAQAMGKFALLAEGAVAGNEITDFKIDGVSVIEAPIVLAADVALPADVQAFGQSLIDAINAFASIVDYTATGDAGRPDIITVTAVSPSAGPNGGLFEIVTNNADKIKINDFRLVNDQPGVNGGVNPVQSALTDLKVGGVSVIAAPVLWDTSNEATALAIANAINAGASGYTASAVGARVDITAPAPTEDYNGLAVAPTLSNGLVLSPAADVVMSTGTSNALPPGQFVRTIGRKMYSPSGSVLYFSGIDAPTKWTTDNVGAGFIDYAAESSGAEELQAVAEYQNYIAVFAKRIILIWYVDPDPTLNRKVQILKNTGAESGLSVTQFGDADLFYFDISGVRSLRARNASTAASTADIGVAIDTLTTAKAKTLTDSEKQNIIGLIEPGDGRLWFIMKDAIFVFSFFNGSKVSAWSTYVPGYENGAGDIVPFNVDAAVVHNRKVYVRSGDTIYVYGGLAADIQYDKTVAEVWLPYLDANDPTRTKEWQGVDAALEGEWEVRFAMQPTNEAVDDKIATLSETTYNKDRIPSLGASTHISPRFKTVGDGPAKLGAVVVHYDGSGDED